MPDACVSIKSQIDAKQPYFFTSSCIGSWVIAHIGVEHNFRVKHYSYMFTACDAHYFYFFALTMSYFRNICLKFVIRTFLLLILPLSVSLLKISRCYHYFVIHIVPTNTFHDLLHLLIRSNCYCVSFGCWIWWFEEYKHHGAPDVKFIMPIITQFKSIKTENTKDIRQKKLNYYCLWHWVVCILFSELFIELSWQPTGELNKSF